MRHYVYNSVLRDAAVSLLGAQSERLRVLSVGGDPRQDRLLHTAGKVTAAATLDADLAAAANVVLCGLEDAPALARARERSESFAPDLMCFAGLSEALTVEVLRGLALLAECGYAVESHQAAASDFAQASEHVFLLARDPPELSPLQRLKRIIVFDAHSLQTRAGEETAHYNRDVESQEQLDPALLDHTHEVTRFVEGGATGQLGLAAAHEGGEQVYSSTPSIEFDASELSGRLLSIHFDARVLSDWPAQARRLAGGLAMPHLVEVVVATPPDLDEAALEAGLVELRASGVALIIAPMAPLGRDWSDCFLERMGPEAIVAAYYGGPRAPVTPGWDWDVLRAAMNIEGPVFALKTSLHKTRYVASAPSALKAADGFPMVSRAWLQCCGQWSRGGLAPHEFQALTAYHFDAADWMNKHRKLRLAPVMTVRTIAMKRFDGADASEAAARRRMLRLGADEGEAVRAGLRLHAADWAAKHGSTDAKLRFSGLLGAVSLTATGYDGAVARWSASGRARPL